jgi:hypothetical protein
VLRPDSEGVLSFKNKSQMGFQKVTIILSEADDALAAVAAAFKSASAFKRPITAASLKGFENVIKKLKKTKPCYCSR